jgi:hypothetical protein
MCDNYCGQISLAVWQLEYLKQVHCQGDKLNSLCIKLSYEIWLNKINYNKYCMNKK